MLRHALVLVQVQVQNPVRVRVRVRVRVSALLLLLLLAGVLMTVVVAVGVSSCVPRVSSQYRPTRWSRDSQTTCRNNHHSQGERARLVVGLGG